jgi:phage antirepressor YoqD-like protein
MPGIKLNQLKNNNYMRKSRSGLSSQTFSIAQAAKAIKFPGGEIKFFEWLRFKGFLLSDKTPSDKYRLQGWFESFTKTIYQLNPPQIVIVTRVTIKGLAGLEKRVRKEFPICPPCNDLKNTINNTQPE